MAKTAREFWCNCDGAYSAIERLVLRAWEDGRRQGLVEWKTNKKDQKRSCLTCAESSSITCTGLKHGTNACSAHNYRYWKPKTTKKDVT